LLILEAAQKLEASGCEVLAICANTMHMHAERIRSQVPLELVHIAEATAEAITQAQIKSVGLLGTKYVMEGEFYLQTLQNAGLRVLIPDQGDREFVHTAIYDELTQNRFVPETKSRLLAIIERLQADGAEGAILGCTELPLIVAQPESALPLFDTTKLHADAVVARAFA
jgi:aspartate racemase